MRKTEISAWPAGYRHRTRFRKLLLIRYRRASLFSTVFHCFWNPNFPYLGVQPSFYLMDGIGLSFGSRTNHRLLGVQRVYPFLRFSRYKDTTHCTPIKWWFVSRRLFYYYTCSGHILKWETICQYWSLLSYRDQGFCSSNEMREYTTNHHLKGVKWVQSFSRERQERGKDAVPLSSGVLLSAICYRLRYAFHGYWLILHFALAFELRHLLTIEPVKFTFMHVMFSR